MVKSSNSQSSLNHRHQYVSSSLLIFASLVLFALTSIIAVVLVVLERRCSTAIPEEQEAYYHSIDDYEDVTSSVTTTDTKDPQKLGFVKEWTMMMIIHNKICEYHHNYFQNYIDFFRDKLRELWDDIIIQRYKTIYEIEIHCMASQPPSSSSGTSTEEGGADVMKTTRSFAALWQQANERYHSFCCAFIHWRDRFKRRILPSVVSIHDFFKKQEKYYYDKNKNNKNKPSAAASGSNSGSGSGSSGTAMNTKGTAKEGKNDNVDDQTFSNSGSRNSGGSGVSSLSALPSEFKTQVIRGDISLDHSVALLCDPSSITESENAIDLVTSSSASKNKQTKEGYRNNDNDVEKYISADNAFSGMVLQILPKGGEVYKRNNNNNDEIGDTSTTTTSSTKSLETSSSDTWKYAQDIITEHGQPCDVVRDNNGIDHPKLKMYELMDQVHGNLGLVDVHSLDYAYRPVLLGRAEQYYSGGGGYGVGWNKGPIFGQESWDHRENFYERVGERAFAGGSHGEVWRARRRCNQLMRYNENTSSRSDWFNSKNSQTHTSNGGCGGGDEQEQELIIKRMRVHKNLSLLEAGLREVYFGEILAHCEGSSSLFTTYVDHFFYKPNSESSVELWIVFENAGPSLRSFIYTPVSSEAFFVYQHSDFWRRMRMGPELSASASTSSVAIIPTEKNEFWGGENSDNASSDQHNILHPMEGANKGGKILLKKILRQILSSAAKLHERGVIHRDIKPSNIMCKTGLDVNDIRFWDTNFTDIQCVLGDFSSAIDDFSLDNFYSKGPSKLEQTDEYAPPEVLFGSQWVPYYEAKPESYDSWSIGVVTLELLLGSPNVFSVDQRTTTLLTNKMEKAGASAEDIHRGLYLAALSQFCIYIPNPTNWPLREGDPLFKASIVRPTCTMSDFHAALRARDPLGKGFDSSYDQLFKLIWGLLAFNPVDRLTPAMALEHVYFRSDDSYHLSELDQNAIESQTLDPRLDMNVGERVIDDFVCPKCGKHFSDLGSCQMHATSRRHAKFCTYEMSSLPPCLNAHSMLPAHPGSGYCDIQGRRRVIEDFHTVHFREKHQFYGVFDGHNGNLASKYASSSLHKRLALRLDRLDDDINDNSKDWKLEVEKNMIETFQELHEGVVQAVESYPGDVMRKSGTTATALFVTEKTVVIANVGDSRAILSVGASYNPNNKATPLQLTEEHVAGNESERKRIEALGGFVENRGGVPRVNGTLVLSRSIGDTHLSEYLLQTPHVVAMTKDEMKEKCRHKSSTDNQPPCFIVLASDGLWDVVSNQEAIDMVELTIQKFDHHQGKIEDKEGGAFQEAAEMLTKEAYVRGSTDNIGVCVVAIE